mgnify:FL=1
MKAAIAMQDTEDGQIALNTCFEGGFNPQSHAHQHAYLLIKIMDSIASKNSHGELSAMAEQDLDALVKDTMELLAKEQFSEHDPIPEEAMKAPKLMVVKR